jgi:hypothetical protein
MILGFGGLILTAKDLRIEKPEIELLAARREFAFKKQMR